jgi:quercetin dioxygenase-like cupin family protein
MANKMIIKEIIEEVETSAHPVARALHKGDHFKILAIAFKKGMKLKDHQAHLVSKLTVLEGLVVYIQGECKTELNKFEDINIPVNVIHSVEALQDSLCLLSQG